MTNAGTVAVLNGILAGVIAAVVAWQLNTTVAVAVTAGLGFGVLVAALLLAYAGRSWRRAGKALGSRFPTRGTIEPLHAGPTADVEPMPGLGAER